MPDYREPPRPTLPPPMPAPAIEGEAPTLCRTCRYGQALRLGRVLGLYGCEEPTAKAFREFVLALSASRRPLPEMVQRIMWWSNDRNQRITDCPTYRPAPAGATCTGRST